MNGEGRPKAALEVGGGDSSTTSTVDDLSLFSMDSTRDVAERDADRLVTDLRWRALRDNRHGVQGAWRQLAEDALEKLAATGRTFLVSEMYDPPYNVPRPPSSKWAGSVTNVMAKAGRLRLVGFEPSALASSRGAVIRRWVGVR